MDVFECIIESGGIFCTHFIRVSHVDPDGMSVSVGADWGKIQEAVSLHHCRQPRVFQADSYAKILKNSSINSLSIFILSNQSFKQFDDTIFSLKIKKKEVEIYSDIFLHKNTETSLRFLKNAPIDSLWVFHSFSSPTKDTVCFTDCWSF